MCLDFGFVMNGYIQVITTIDTEEKANEIAEYLLGNKAAACVQIIPISSKYKWKGKIESAMEWMCLIKGKDFDKIKKLIKEKHPYDVPEIIEIPITKGSIDYLKWIDEETC